MSRGKPAVGKPARDETRAPKPAKARASKRALPRTAAAKAPPASKRSPRRTVPSAPVPPVPTAGPAEFAQVASALVESRREDARDLLEAGRMSVAGVQAVLERRIETLRETLAELRLLGKLMRRFGARESVAHVDELARGALQLTLANVRELMALATSTQREALGILARRLQADLEEFRQLQAALRARRSK
jgi:hypothetical protein